MRADVTARMGQLGAVLAERMPVVLDAALALLESVPPALDAARSERYEIKHQIGAGGMAEVLLGTVRGAEGFHRLVAVKRVRSALADEARFGAMLIREAQLASRLSHPNVVSVLDFDRDNEGRPFLVMEYVDGVDLRKLIETGPVPPSVAIFIVRELLAALGYIHDLRGRDRERGLVHRDVTPHNVLLSWEGGGQADRLRHRRGVRRNHDGGSGHARRHAWLQVARASVWRGARWPIRSVRGRDRALGAPRVPVASRRVAARPHGGNPLPGHPAPERVPAGRPR